MRIAALLNDDPAPTITPNSTNEIPPPSPQAVAASSKRKGEYSRPPPTPKRPAKAPEISDPKQSQVVPADQISSDVTEVVFNGETDTQPPRAAVLPPRVMYEDLVTHARRRAADLGRRLPCFWSSPPKDLPEWLVSLLDYIAAMHEPETLARITLDDILGLISNCGFDDRDQAERELRSHCYDLYRNVLDTWPEDAPIVEWLSDAVPTSFRKVKLDKEIEKGLLTKLRPPSPLELSAWAPKTQEPGSTPLDPPRGAAQSLQVPVCGHTSRVAALNINGNASIDKSERMRFTNWKFREGSSDGTHLIDMEVGGGSHWVTEEYAHRKFKSQLLRFWNRQGGRKEAIEARGRTITQNTKYLIHDLLEESSYGSEFYVEWVGYGDESHSWEPASEIDKELIRAFRRRRLRKSSGLA